MNINPKYKFRLITSLLILSFLGIAVCLYLLKGIVGEVRKSKIEVTEINRDIALLDRISKEKEQYSEDIKMVKSTLPSEYYEVSFFTEQIEKLAQSNNLNLKINIDKNKKEESNISSILYSLEIKGSYQSVAHFLSQISKLPYHTTVEKVGITNEEGVLTSKINFKLFVQ